MTMDEKLAEISTRPRVVPATPKDLEDIRTIHSDLQVQTATVVAENAALKVKVKQLEDQIEAQPPTTPSGNPPAILDEHFTNGVDWTRYFSDGNPAAPQERFVKTPEGLRVTWIAGNPSGSKRSELAIRATAGGGETARRDPVGSERWYAVAFLIPNEYKLDDAMKDEKRLLWQCHQTGGANPPLSLELRNGTFRLVRSVGDEREHHLNPTGNPPGIPCTKGVWHTLVVHVLWHATDGWLECWFDALHVPKVTRKTCNALTEGVQCKIGSYQPGYTSFPAGYRIEHLVKAWQIGDEDNVRGDFA